MRAKKFAKFTTLLVNWDDITSDAKWHDAQAIDKADTTSVKTVGFFICNEINKNKRRIIKLAHSVAKDGDCDYTCIPYGCISNIKELK